MVHRITILPQQQNTEALSGENLLQVLRRAGYGPDAPCGGEGRCGKCRVLVNGKEVLACRTAVDRDMTVTLPGTAADCIHTPSIESAPAVSCRGDVLLALDIGTTTVAGYLLDGRTGQELAQASLRNPQVTFGADVITRIRQALHGHMEELTGLVRRCAAELILDLCQTAGVSAASVTRVCLVGNPAMDQLFLGIRPDNLAQIPFSPVLTEARTFRAGEVLPPCPHVELFAAPHISGFVGGDTVACILATGMDVSDETVLLVDIGTNGEMVLGNRSGLTACSTAAGPALEGANIQFGMRGQPGAIDRVRLENGQLRCRVIGGGEALGICGSGLIDAVAAALEAGWLNARGKILREDSRIPLTDTLYLTQEDIRQVQLAKGAIAAGIRLMAEHRGIPLQDIRRVYLAGAFGTCMDPGSACRIGLLPRELEGKVTAVGNAAGAGAKRLVREADAGALTQAVLRMTDALELGALPEFPRCFARNMRF